MTHSDDSNPRPLRSDPGARMRNILSASKTPVEAEVEDEPLARLPRNPSAASAASSPPVSSVSFVSSPPDSSPKKKKFFRWNKVLPAFWTIASLVSMSINIVLIVLLVILYQNRATFEPLTDVAMDMGKSLLSGLYSNFEKMDDAHIRTNIAVESEIPVQFDLALNQETEVVLSRDVVIQNAHVHIATGLLNINAPATVTLPAGTTLPIILSLTVPVDTTVPVHLDVPVDIALNQTDLHEPFTGLQDVLRPLYCLVDPNALSIYKLPICPP